jgi:hypothetical protein
MVAVTPERFMAWLRADLVKLAVVLVIVTVMAVAFGTLVR